MTRRFRARAAAALVFLAAGFVYARTLMPGVGPIDAGELTLAAWLPGIAHPPGSPVYVLLGFPFSRIPLGTVALRMNAFSALASALAAAAVGAAVYSATRRRAEPARPIGSIEAKREPRSRRPRRRGEQPTKSLPESAGLQEPTDPNPEIPRLCASLAAGLAFAFSKSVWSYATVTEVYALNLAVLAGVFWALFKWRERTLNPDPPVPGGPRRSRFLTVAAFLFGLSLCVHHGSALACAPAIGFLVLVTDSNRLLPWLRGFGEKRRDRPKIPSDTFLAWRRAALGLGAGLLPYLYMPLRAMTKPLLNWGDPSNLERFWWHVSARWFQVFMFEETTAESLASFARLFTEQLPVPGLLAAGIGLVCLLVRDRVLSGVVALVALGNFLVLFAYGASDDSPAFLLPTVLATAFLVGEAVRTVLGWVWRLGRTPPALFAIRATAVTVTLALPASALLANLRECDQSRNHIAEDFSRNVLASVSPNEVLITAEWIVTVSPLMYLQHVAKEARGVTVVDINLVKRSWYRDYMRAVDGRLYGAVEELYERFLSRLWFFEHGHCGEGRRPRRECGEIQESFEALMNGFVDAAAAMGRPVSVTSDVDPSFDASGKRLAASWPRVPWGLVYRLRRGADLAAFRGPGPALSFRGLWDGSHSFAPGSPVGRKVPGLYFEMLANRGEFLLRMGDPGGARPFFENALRLRPQEPRIQALLKAMPQGAARELNSPGTSDRKGGQARRDPRD